MSPSSALGSSQRSVVSHRRVGGFSDSSFPGLYSVDKVSSEFFFLHASSRCFRKTHQKCRQRRVGIDFARGSAAEPRNAKRGGAKTRGHFPTHPIRGLRNADPERRRRPSGGVSGGGEVFAGVDGGQMKELGAGFKERLMSLCAPSSISSSAAPTAEVCVTYSRSTLH